MKNIILFVLIVLLTFDLYSQINKGAVVLSFSGNYMKTNTESGVTTNLNSIQGQYLRINSSIGYFFTGHFVAGIGIDYDWDKEKRFSQLYFNRFLQVEKLEIKSKVLLPNLYIGYYHQIINNLYINTNVKFSYGKVKSNYNTLYAGSGQLTFDSFVDLNNGESYVISKEDESEQDFFCTNINPELTYFVSTRFGQCIGVGSIEYSMIDWKNDNSSWVVNFNPSYWNFGVKIMI